MKFFKILLYFTVISIGLIVGFSLFVTYSYQSQATGFLQSEINKRLNCKVGFESISLSTFKNIPNLSVSFEKFYLLNPADFVTAYNNDTLVLVNNCVVEFNIIDFFKGKYVLRSINASQGFINVLFNDKGKHNLDIVKLKENVNSADFKIELNSVKLKDIEFYFENPVKHSKINTYINKISLYGSFYKNDFDININSETFAKQLVFDKVSYINKKNVKLSSQLSVKNDLLQFKNGNVKIEDLNFFANGLIDNKNSIIDLQIKSNELSVKSLISVLPWRYRKKINSLEKNKGKVTFSSYIEGKYSKYSNPGIKLFFKISDAAINLSNHENVIIEVISTDGIFSNGAYKNSESSYIQLNNIIGEINGNPVKGFAELKNFISPVIKGNVIAAVNLAGYSEIINYEGIEYLSGNSEFDLTYDLKFNNTINDLNKNNIENATLKGKIILSDAAFKYKNLPVPVTNISGTVLLDDLWDFEGLNFSVDSNNFTFNGSFNTTLYDLIKGDYNPVINGSLSSKHFNYDNYRRSINSGVTNTVNTGFPFPENLSYHINFVFDEITYEKSMATQVNGIARYKPNSFFLENVNFNAFEGKVKGDFAFYSLPKGVLFKTNSYLENINIKQLFYGFNNFDQNTLLYNNISGSLNGKISLSSYLDSNIDIIDSTLMVEGNITLVNGELTDYGPLYHLSKYIAIEELSRIKFSTLNNIIIIRDKTITIPQMEINSSAFNLIFSGYHTFDNVIDYRLKVYLSEFLWKKARQNKKENLEYATENKNKLMIPIKITGTTEVYEVKYDKDKTIAAIQAEVKNEKIILKKAIGNEFNPEKNDKNNEIDKSFEIIWEEEENTNMKTENKGDAIDEEKPANKYKHTIIWEEE